MTCVWNTVVMFRTDKPKDETEKDKQVPIAHRIMYGLYSAMQPLSPLAPHTVQLDVADTQTRKDGSPVVLPYTLDNAIELLKVLPSTLLDTASPCYSRPHHSPTGGDHAPNGRDLRIRR